MKTPISADILTVAATLSRIAANPISPTSRAELADAARTLAALTDDVMALEAMLRPAPIPGYNWIEDAPQ